MNYEGSSGWCELRMECPRRRRDFSSFSPHAPCSPHSNHPTTFFFCNSNLFGRVDGEHITDLEEQLQGNKASDATTRTRTYAQGLVHWCVTNTRLYVKQFFLLSDFTVFSSLFEQQLSNIFSLQPVPVHLHLTVSKKVQSALDDGRVKGFFCSLLQTYTVNTYSFPFCKRWWCDWLT